MLAHLIDFLEDERGSSFMEYALLAAFVSIIIAGSLGTMGSDTSAAFALATSDVNQVAYETCVRTAESTLTCELH